MIAASVGRLPIGMTTLAIVLFVAHQAGSFARAGLAAGAFAIANAIATPIQSRLIDRLGASRVLLAFVTLESAALVSLVVSGDRADPTVSVVVVLSALAGAARPALSSVSRMLWPRLIGERATLDTALALEGVLVEVFYTAGPLLTAGIIAIASPAVALLVAAALSLTGTITVATAQLARERPPTPAESSWGLGPLRTGATGMLVATMLLMGFSFGAIEVGVPAFAARHGAPAIAGVALAANSLASMASGIWYGARTWDAPMPTRYRIFAVLFALCYAPLLIAPGMSTFTAALALAGIAIAPLVTTVYVLIETVAPKRALTEAYGWATTGTAAGSAAGAALSGALVHHVGVHAPFAMGLAFAAAMAALALLGARAMPSATDPGN